MKMKAMKLQRAWGRIFILLVCVIAALLCVLPTQKTAKDGGRDAITASAYGGDLIAVDKYTVDMQVHTNRKVSVTEQVTVTFLQSGLSMFYRSLPTVGCIYEGFSASCAGNEAFYFEVADNPDVSGFIDVNCIGGVAKGRTWTYTISYTMLQGVENEDGMIIDVIGYGWSVPLHNVTATVHFPEAVTSAEVYVGHYGTDKTYPFTLSSDKKTLTVTADSLKLGYNSTYAEWMAEGITVDFAFNAGVLDSYADTRIFTENIWKLLVGALVCTGLGILLFVTKKKRDIVTIISVKPPKGMSPMQMGKILDGSVDNADVTSMVYYFAHKGYLKIDLSDEDDPELIRVVKALPESAPQYEKTLFNGLFAQGEYKLVEGKDGRKEVYTVSISKLSGKFYEAMQAAKMQVRSPKPMYERSSCFLYAIGQLLGGVFAAVAAYLMGKRLGGGYVYFAGLFLFIPLILNLFLGIVKENYRYKWSAIKRLGIFLAEVSIALLFTGIFILAFANHIMTGWEKFVLCIGAFAPAFLTQNILVRTQTYCDTLGEILGFKDFIVVTEEDKIKFMLEDNPELYYEVLPYAQVLGVTDEWEKKFAKITLQPPTWYVGNMSFFDYLILRRCMSIALTRSFAEMARKAHGGGHIGRSGGGGGFGGFGGGGFGGGGGGAR